MADKKITELQLRDNVDGDVNFPSDDGIQSYRVTAPQIKDYILPSLGITGAKVAAATLDPSKFIAHYFNGYFENNGGTDPLWTTSSTSFADPALTGTNTLITRHSNGLGTVVKNASDLCGITFTPASASAVYLVMAGILAGDVTPASGAMVSARLWDGTTVIDTADMMSPFGTTAAPMKIPFSGIFIPGTTSPVSLTFQLAQINGTAVAIQNNYDSLAKPVEMTLVRIA